MSHDKALYRSMVALLSCQLCATVTNTDVY